MEQRQIVGKCPRCGKDVIVKNKIYECSSNKYKNEDGDFIQTSGCGFKIWKRLAQQEIKPEVMKEILEDGETSGKVYNFVSKNNKQFSARLKLNDAKDGLEFIFDKHD